MVLAVVFLCWVGVVGVSASDDICCIPLTFKVHGMAVPTFDFGGDSVHSLDHFHKGDGDTSCEEVDESVLISDFTKGNVVFELGDIISKWQGF